MTTIRQYVESRVRLARYVAVPWVIVLLMAAITIFPVLASKDGFGWMFIGLLPPSRGIYRHRLVDKVPAMPRQPVARSVRPSQGRPFTWRLPPLWREPR